MVDSSLRTLLFLNFVPSVARAIPVVAEIFRLLDFRERRTDGRLELSISFISHLWYHFSCGLPVGRLALILSRLRSGANTTRTPGFSAARLEGLANRRSSLGRQRLRGERDCRHLYLPGGALLFSALLAALFLEFWSHRRNVGSGDSHSVNVVRRYHGLAGVAALLPAAFR